MIFVTVGTQLPFDRLVEAVLSIEKKISAHMVLQVGAGKVFNESCIPFLSADQTGRYISECDVVVAHAGMGTIITALSKGKPVVVLPRKSLLGEHRNNHQLSTCKSLDGLSGLFIAWEEDEILSCLEKARKWQSNAISLTPPPFFCETLNGAISRALKL